jgi:hypothetical protein
VKIEKRILIGKLLGVDITGKPLKQLEGELDDHAKSSTLKPIYTSAVDILTKSTPEDRVTQALAKAIDDVGAEVDSIDETIEVDAEAVHT